MLRHNALSIGLAVAAALVFGAPATAIFVDFEDVPVAIYNAGNNFTSNGIQFNVISYNGTGQGLSVNEMGTPGNIGVNAFNTVGVDVALPAGIQSLAFDFHDGCTGCSHVGITVNGTASSPTVQLVDLHNTDLGGVQINILPPSQPGFQARLQLLGPITSFATGGTEYLLDNFEIRVPEPTTATMGLIALGSLLVRRRS